ncbi:SSI family serine proteinase inhibitor [Streptomyces sp. ACA25]|uniref:SSI family serine proteinase inhibitor n=1 Tax=Streptomyces sp. ACA25 TaxID=3022596 RepID=UPI002307EE6E|nr:SSI family serine proteinase inhibitor [Streptomyces sp. ACA25]MDB1086149.1 SSI family serine proteinase inhibitor [Streptomyces sp. ACA25]
MLYEPFVAAALAAAAATMPLSPGAAGQDPAAEAGHQLTITVTDTGEPEHAQVHTLRCEPAGGDHPEAATACDVLAELEDPFSPVPPDSLCTYIHGGPATAVIEGTWAGEPVDAAFARTNGCEVARWDRLVPVLPHV